MIGVLVATRGPLRRLHARAARHIYRGVREGGVVPWLGILVMAVGFAMGALVDAVLHATGWTKPNDNRGVFWGLVITGGWVLFALVGGGGYGSDDEHR